MRLALPLALLAATMPAAAIAQDTGFFAGIDVIGGFATGTSSTLNGGMIASPANGSGVVDNVRFGTSYGFAARAGYRFNPQWTLFASYQQTSGDVSWDASFGHTTDPSHFDGTAQSGILWGNIGYAYHLSPATTLSLEAGLGMARNRLSSVAETIVAKGISVSDVDSHTTTSPAARIGVGLHHRLRDNVTFDLTASFARIGSMRTGNSRVAGGEWDPINPYVIDDITRTDIAAGVTFVF